MSQKDLIDGMQDQWNHALLQQRFPMRMLYDRINDDQVRIPWSNLVTANRARPHVVVCLWLVCHGKLVEKDRLLRFGVIQESMCNLCRIHDESITHLLFECGFTKAIWSKVLKWLEVVHNPSSWNDELTWIISKT